MRTVHKLVSVAFQENFSMSEMPPDWQSGHIVTESKDSRAKQTTGGDGVVYAYRFGAMTFVDGDPAERKFEMDTLRDHIGLGLDTKVMTEEFVIETEPSERPRVEHNRVVLDVLTAERRAVVAQVIAQSAAMEYYETIIGKTKSQVAELIDGLADHGRIGLSPRKLFRKIGYAMAIRNEVLGILHMLDKPDLIWDDPQMDHIYDDLRAAFDLAERFKALEYKVKVIQESLEILADIAKDARIIRIDLAIVALIVVEVVFSLMTRFHWLGW